MNLQLGQLVDQRGRQLDDAVVAKRKVVPESDLPGRETKRLRSLGHEARQVQHPGLLTGLSTADSSTGSPPAFEQSTADTPWTLNDTRPDFPRDLTGHVVREGGDLFASGSFRDVAVKAMKTYLRDDGNDHDKKNMRLCREYQMWVNLKHFNILPLFGTTMNLGQFPAMVCPWLENGSLTSYLERPDGTLMIMERLALLGDAAAGLQYLHSQSVVHGDLSGLNVLIDGNSRACISDFGLSVLLTELGESTYTESRHVGGVLCWIAPELLDNEVPEDKEHPLHLSDAAERRVLTGRVPYHYYPRDSLVQSAILKRTIPQCPDRALVTDHQWTFMQRCWMPIGVGEPRPRGDEIVEF
ncbi:hypothetical protein PAXINDRAFT_172144, partial [Paxillus involutus ATCC 200175]